MRAPFFKLAVFGLLPAFSSCSILAERSGKYLNTDQSFASPNHDSRIQILVVHYTALPLEDSLSMLTSASSGVSAHYLVPDSWPSQRPYTVFQLVPEASRAWHAGVSYWQGNRLLNPSSVGVEMVNLGFPASDEGKPLMARAWYPYTSSQVDAFADLARGIVERHNIRPDRVVGHADVAPGRKYDPGPLFPWEVLHRVYGIGAWYDDESVAFYRACHPWDGRADTLQRKLSAYGYEVTHSGVLDTPTRDVMAAFQMHFHPSSYDGVPDKESVAKLDALLEKYRGQMRSPHCD